MPDRRNESSITQFRSAFLIHRKKTNKTKTKHVRYLYIRLGEMKSRIGKLVRMKEAQQEIHISLLPFAPGRVRSPPSVSEVGNMYAD